MDNGCAEMENADSAERRRRRQLIVLLTSFGIPVILVFGIVDYLEGDTIEFLVDVTLVAILAVGLIAIFKYNKDRPAYFFGLNMLALAVLYNVAIGAGKESAIYWVFILPSLLFFFQGRRDGLVSVGFVLFLLSLLLFQPGLLHAHDYGMKTGLRFFPSLFFVAVIGYGLESSRDRFSDMLRREHEELLDEKANLEKALKQIKTLHGLLPMCSSCKKIRDDSGYWKQIEAYLHEHSDAKFSHGICPDCAKELYPDIKIYNDEGEAIIADR
jgi:hypothetical protein